MSRVNEIIDEILQKSTLTALSDAHINDDETALLRLLKTEFEVVRREVVSMDLNHLNEHDLRLRIKMISRDVLNNLTKIAIADGKITPDEMAILHSVIRNLM